MAIPAKWLLGGGYILTEAGQPISREVSDVGITTWTAATRTIADTPLNTPFTVTDATAQRQIIFRIGGTVYFGRIQNYISPFSVTLAPSNTLPTADGFIVELIVLNFAEPYSYTDYIAEIVRLISDHAGKLSTANIQQALGRAVTDYARDSQFSIGKICAGNGTSSYNLMATIGGTWRHGFSQIVAIEFPTGSNPPQFIPPARYSIYDDGTAQDGTNLRLLFQGYSPAVGQSFIIHHTTEMMLPEAGVQNFPSTQKNFRGITLLGAIECCRQLSAVYAQSTDNTLTADAVDYRDKSQKYSALARLYQEQYALTMFGNKQGALQTAQIIEPLDVSTPQGSIDLFH